MNLFLLHKNLKKCARQHCDKHVVKMVLELAQLLSTAWWVLNPDLAERHYKKGLIYKKTHINHPVAVWTREHLNNYDVVAELAYELTKEYTYRYGKIHKTTPKIMFMMRYPPKNIEYRNIKKLGGYWNTTPPKQCFGDGNDYLKREDAVEGYRNYYNVCKKHLHSWKKRSKPEWINTRGLAV